MDNDESLAGSEQQHEKESRNRGTAAKTGHFVPDSRWAVETEQTSEAKKKK